MGVVVYSVACVVRVANATIIRSTSKQFQRYWEYEYYGVLCAIASRVRKWPTYHGSKQMRVLTVVYYVAQRYTQHLSLIHI